MMRTALIISLGVALACAAGANTVEGHTDFKPQITKAPVSPGPSPGGPAQPGPGGPASPMGPQSPGSPGPGAVGPGMSGPGSPMGPGNSGPGRSVGPGAMGPGSSGPGRGVGPGATGPAPGMGPGAQMPVNPAMIENIQREATLMRYDPERIVREIDSDGSGTLETDELPDDAFGEYLSHSDTDGDGTITSTEMVTYFSETQLEGKDNGAVMSAYNQLLGQLDTDDSGNIEADEVESLNPRRSASPTGGIGGNPTTPGSTPVPRGPGRRP